MKLSERAGELKWSELDRLSAKMNRMKEKGKDIISLDIGDNDFPIPKPVQRAAHEVIERGFTQYTSASGDERLKRVLAKDFARDGIEVAPDEIIVSNGAKPLLSALIAILCNPGDRVLIPIPTYYPYLNLTRFYGGEVIVVNTKQDYFVLTPERIRNRLSLESKILILTTPNNPTGMVWDLVGILKELESDLKDVWIVVDEAYHRILYDDIEYVSPASQVALRGNIITVRSLPNTYSMSGLRISYFTGPQKVLDAMKLYLKLGMDCPCSISQYSVMLGLEATQELIVKAPQRMIEELDQRRQYIMEWLRERSISFPAPQGGLYVFANLSRYGDTLDLANRFLEEAYVAVTPGSAFGGLFFQDFIRISFASEPLWRIQEALDRIDRVLNGEKLALAELRSSAEGKQRWLLIPHPYHRTIEWLRETLQSIGVKILSPSGIQLREAGCYVKYQEEFGEGVIVELSKSGIDRLFQQGIIPPDTIITPEKVVLMINEMPKVLCLT